MEISDHQTLPDKTGKYNKKSDDGLFFGAVKSSRQHPGLHVIFPTGTIPGNLTEKVIRIFR
jgi:hypothetical protein